jgi:uncharacterized protein (TIGR03084 family)
MSVMDELVADLKAENAALDGLLASISDETWLVPTPAEGWDSRDTVTHLAWGNEGVRNAVTGGRGVLEGVSGSVDDLEARLLERGRAMSPSSVLDWWRSSCAELHAALADADPRVRVPWGMFDMSTASMATNRLLDTWAHSLDCFAAAGIAPVDTERLRHIAFMSHRALERAVSVQGLEPAQPLRLELEAPTGGTWRLGPDDAPNVISGTASDWCRVAVERDREAERSRLVTAGPDAAALLVAIPRFITSMGGRVRD